MKVRLKELKDEPWKKSERLIRVKLDAITGKIATGETADEDVVEEKIAVKQKSRIVAVEKEDTTGFEVFSNTPPEVLVPKRQFKRQSTQKNDNQRRNDKPVTAPASVKQLPEKVEIPEQLF